MAPADLWRPAAAASSLKRRAQLLQDLREFFAKRDVMEVETPLTSSAGNTDPAINSIMTDNGRYLRTSPEFALKRLLAADIGDIYELGRVFRAGEAGHHHNPEFTMLEWYRTGFSYHQLMDEVAAIVRHCGRGKFDQWPQSKLSYHQLFQTYLGIDPFSADKQTLAAVARRHGIEDMDLSRKQWLDLLISFVIQPALEEESLTFVYDFPVDQAALARIRPTTPPLAERFELYLGRVELANGYQELTDAKEQQRRFDAENELREQNGADRCEVDRHLLAALAHGLPDCSGVALGVDRLLMAICDADTLDEVMAFPFSRA